jgi:ankyrin repeat protein
MGGLSTLTSVVRRARWRRYSSELLKRTRIVALIVVASACTESPQEQLLTAALRGDVFRVESLLNEQDAEVNWRAPRTGNHALGIAAAHNQAAIVRLLMERGADPNIATLENMTALHSAAYHGYVDIARMLIEAGADVDTAESRYGFTPLAYAARNGHVEVIKLLLNAGARREIAVKDGRRPLDVARQYRHPEAASVLMTYEPAAVGVR